MGDTQEVLRTLVYFSFIQNIHPISYGKDMKNKKLEIDEKTFQLNDWHLTDEQAQLVSASGLGALSIIQPGRIDHPLVAANAERWCFETNSFDYNILIGEMTPILFDVYEILRLAVDDDPVICRPTSDLRQFIENNLGIVPTDGNSTVIKHSWLKANFHTLPPDVTPV
ncbi:hypothetical protein AMTR_s00020p00228680 [Amborella trichopoda]|uniref:Aminotransferase-like plant mobile domain-containing protein n=1 Tax=Amborella trichopoda TaxID=13333 RepID=W1PPF9_AMBTC|nr:hypothetical protein AMTR_s00020p00228680 [Amborella trichopoda]